MGLKEGIQKLFWPVTAPITFIQNNFKAVVLVVIIAALIVPASNEQLVTPNLQSIALEGPIFEVSTLLEQIEEAQNNSNIKGVLLEVNSPGGAIAPSVEVAYAIKRLREQKPVIVYSSGILASGSYYASIWANQIIANPGTLVGSIGVIMEGANFEDLMKKVGIKSQVAKAGKFKQIGTAEREWTNFERAELEKVINANYDMFVSDVAEARELNVSNHTIFADAHIFTAEQAVFTKLIDRVGVKYDAKKALEELSGVSEAHWKQEDKFEKFMKQFAAEGISLVHTYFPQVTLR